ncbi:50S ribosomal protein L25/general stress protein Ctc [Sporolactobacillus sp. THM7-7]|nr:50S ribosomal protein L25/general stress protein Ctc [Sporolactobacillus sp. THM7-7]
MAVLNAAVRDDSKKSASKALRREGKIPSVVYGKSTENVSISVNAGDMTKLFRKEGRNALITLNIDDKEKYTVMAHDLQFNHLKGTIQHIDFLQVNENEEIDAVVPVVLQGTEKAEIGDAVMNHQTSELTVRALPKDLPGAIEVDVSSLSVGDSIRISDIASNASYQIVGDPDEVIVSVSYGNKQPEESAPEAEEAAPEAEEPSAE